MKPVESFGVWLKAQRARKGLTLRVFARKAGLDPGNLSRYERGVVPPPRDEAVLARVGHALGLRPTSQQWKQMADLAAIGGKRIPPDVAEDWELLKALPVLLRTLKDKNLTRNGLISLARRIQES